MAIFKSIPAVSTQKDTTSPERKKPSGVFYEENTKTREPITDVEADKKLSKIIKPLVDEPDPVVDDDDFVLQEIEKAEREEKEKRDAERRAKDLADAPKKPKKEAVSHKKKIKPGDKASLERRKKMKKAKEKDGTTKLKTKKEGTKTRTKKKSVDISKMVTTTKKPQTSSSTKTVYHVSKRGETREDRVWKVFIQESNKVIKLFDYQADALEFAKQLAKNKDDGSYVVLHGLDGKIRKI